MIFRHPILLDLANYATPSPKTPQSVQTEITPFNNLLGLFDVFFLRQERTYTKLKYSRVPQYDMVSGGSAAILAGFLGFLICERFGFELLDSGDFYYLFMYGVFGSFIGRLLFKLQTTNATHIPALHPYWVGLFVLNCIAVGRCWLSLNAAKIQKWWY